MNYKKSKVLLKKIKALHDSIDQEAGFSSLEQDLFLQYLRELYDNVISDEKSSRPAKSPDRAKHRDSNESHSPEQKNEPRTPKPPEVKKVVLEDPQSTPNSGQSGSVAASDPIPKDILELLNESESSFEVSRVLGGKIQDISKSMGINEKILTINELFQGQQSLFEETVAKLNAMDSYESAKSFLAEGVASEMKWSEKRRKGKAIHFLHLVKRKYSI